MKRWQSILEEHVELTNASNVELIDVIETEIGTRCKVVEYDTPNNNITYPKTFNYATGATEICDDWYDGENIRYTSEWRTLWVS